MNIAMFSDSYLPLVNGIASSLGLLHEHLGQLGHQVTLFTPQMKGIDDSSPTIVRVPSLQISKTPPFYFASPLSSRVLKIVLDNNFDVVHTHTPLAMGALAYQAATLLKRPLIYTYHTLLPEYVHYLGWPAQLKLVRKSASYLDAFSCSLCQLVIAPSDKVKALLEVAGVLTRCEVVPNGIKLDEFSEQNRGYLQAQGHVRQANTVLLAVGRLGQEKNPQLLIRMLPYVLKEAPQVKLVFAGDGYLLPQLRRLVEEVGVSDSVVFLGNVPQANMPGLYAAANLFVTAATTEVHPISLLEALASGLPVVAVRDAAYKSAVVDGQNGFFSPAQAAEFAAKVLEVLRNPPLQAEMAAASLRLSQRFSIETHTSRLLELYGDLNKRYTATCKGDAKNFHHTRTMSNRQRARSK